MTTSLLAILAIVFAQILGALGAVYFKKSSAKLSFKPRHLIKNKPLIIGLFFYGISAIICIPALKYGELSILYPFVSTVYVFVALLSTRMLGEKMNLLKWLGIALIILGVSFIGMSA